MKKSNSHMIKAAVALIAAGGSQGLLAQDTPASSLTEALTNGKVSADFRLRYESVEQDNQLKDADALTLRSRLGYTTASFNGLSAMLEVEDVQPVAGVDDYSVGPTGFNPGEYSVIADPETTEVDQAFLQYSNDRINTRLGRQRIVYDNHRFIGDVGWRQDRQTFDAFTFDFIPTKNTSLSYNYLDERNRIFADDADVDSSDHLFNASWKMPLGTLTGYAYLLDNEDADRTNDTYGARLNGSTDAGNLKLLYTAELATQDFEQGTADYEADYYFVEGGVAFNRFTLKAGYEYLGSDDGEYGFSTPLATLHAHNGWADQFLNTPAQGLVDMSFSVGTQLAGGNLNLIYHDYEAAEDTPAVDDLGDEIDVVYSRKFGKYYSSGIKYASYSAGDINVDTDKLWVWLGMSF
ncbi:alginate export family protein [Modicisalibacter ilicicola]|nr:alginate export family protein [Halomonas ilicicola]